MSALMIARRAVLARAIAASSLGIVAGACTDEPTRPSAADASPAISARLPIGETERVELRAALLFAREHSALALAKREAGEGVAAAFERLGERVEANDRVGVERAIVAARAALTRYEALAGDVGGAATAADIAALRMTLDQTAALIREAGSLLSEDGDSREMHATTAATSKSNRRLEP